MMQAHGILGLAVPTTLTEALAAIHRGLPFLRRGRGRVTVAEEDENFLGEEEAVAS
jgi:hypothetical protein